MLVLSVISDVSFKGSRGMTSAFSVCVGEGMRCLEI